MAMWCHYKRFNSKMKVVLSNGYGWDHVSVSMHTRIPMYEEMEFVRGICFKDDELVLQLSVPRSDHINLHPNCLHMWRPQHVEIPLPPTWMV